MREKYAWELFYFMDDRIRHIKPKARFAYFEDGFYETTTKGKLKGWFHKNPLCFLLHCDLCGKQHGENIIKTRSDVYGWNWAGEKKGWVVPSKNLLCTSCWNKVKPIVKMYDMANDIKYLINMTKKEIRNGKDQDNGRHARVSGEHDDGRQERGIEQ
jgi:hypothetical protein